MSNTLLLAGMAALLVLSAGCASETSFPGNGSQAVSQASEFVALQAQAESFKGKTMRLAGRMVRVRTEGADTVIVAEWLPFPEDPESGPDELLAQEDQLFTVRYPGSLDVLGALEGNKFLAIGRVEGMRNSLPSLVATCLWVWKTGPSPIQEEPDVEFAGYPVLEETYCTPG